MAHGIYRFERWRKCTAYSKARNFLKRRHHCRSRATIQWANDSKNAAPRRSVRGTPVLPRYFPRLLFIGFLFHEDFSDVFIDGDFSWNATLAEDSRKRLIIRSRTIVGIHTHTRHEDKFQSCPKVKRLRSAACVYFYYEWWMHSILFVQRRIKLREFIIKNTRARAVN